MGDRHKTKAQLLQEMETLRTEITTLKQQCAQAKTQQTLTERGATDLADITSITKLGFWSFDIASGQVTWSDEIYHLFGLEPGQITPTYDWLVQAICPEYRELHQITADTVIATGKTQPIEYAITRTDGSIGWVWARIEAVQDDRGQTVGLQGMAMDIGDRKVMEIALQKSESRLRSLFESNIVGIIFASNHGEIFDGNDCFLTMVGYSREELEAGQLRWDNLTPPEYRPQDEQIITRLRRGETTEPWQKEYYRKDGSRIPVLVGVASLDAELDHTVCVLVDMTEQEKILRRYQTTQAELTRLNAQLEQRIMERTQSLQQSEERLRLAFEAANMGFWDWDILSNQITWSDHLIQITDLDTDSFQGDFQQFVEMIYPDDREKVLRAINHSTHNNEPYDIEFRFTKPDGSIRWAAGRATVLRDPNGFPIRMIGVDLDITARKQVEETLRRVNQELEDRVQELKERNGDMMLLSSMTNYLQAGLTVKDACAVISALSQPLFPDCSGAIFILSSPSHSLERVTFWGDPICTEVPFLSMDCWALRRGRSHSVHKDQHDLLCNHVNHEDPPMESFCIPLVAQGETLGLLYLCAFKEQTLSEVRQQLAKTVAEQLSMAIANLRLREQLHHQSLHDPLTTLFNRRYLEQFFAQELARAKRHHFSICVLMIDIDHFKNFNDSFGHDGGDQVLTAIGALLKNCIRASDVACRYGGEEMLLVLPDTSLDDAYAKAEFLRQAIADLRVTCGEKTLNAITASFGVASYPDHGETVQELLQCADKALYEAKASGRNRVVIAEKIRESA